MPEQFLLPDILQQPEETESLFLAIPPDEPTRPRLASFAQWLCAANGLSGRPLAPNRFHISLHHLGAYPEVPANVVRVASEAAALTAARTPAFVVTFDRVGSFSGKQKSRPCVLRGNEGNASLIEFRRDLGGALRQRGFRCDDGMRFTPHLTLLYGPQIVAEQKIAPISWRATELVLVHSMLGRTRHIPLGRWSLGG